MGRKTARRSVDRSRSLEYRNVAEHFYNAASASMVFEYWPAAGVLIVHAAIAFSDAICVQQAGERSVGDNHEDAVSLLEGIVPRSKENKKAINHLQRLLDEKTRVSYLGELYSPAQTRGLWKQLVNFREWALTILRK